MQRSWRVLYASQVILNATRCATHQIARPRDGPAIARHLRCVSRGWLLCPPQAITTPLPEFALPLRKQVHCLTRMLSCGRLGKCLHITRKRFLAPCFPVRPFDPCGPRALKLYQELEMQSKIRAMALIGLTLPAATHAADLGDTDTAIRLALLPETGAQISAHVAGELLGAMGYTVEYVEADQMRVFSDMRQGRIDVNVEAWEALRDCAALSGLTVVDYPEEW